MRAANALKHRQQSHAFEEDDGMMSSINDLIDHDDDGSKNSSSSSGGPNSNNRMSRNKSVVATSANSSPSKTNNTNSNSAEASPISTNKPSASSTTSNNNNNSVAAPVPLHSSSVVGSRRTSITATGNPKLTCHLLNGLKTIEAEFESDLGSDWWVRSTSSDTTSSGHTAQHVNASFSTRADIGSTTSTFMGNQQTSRVTNMNSGDFTLSDHDIGDSSTCTLPPDHPNAGNNHSNKFHQQQQDHNLNSNQQHAGESASHLFAADGSDKTQDVIKKLEKLSHSALLTYAARISILLGNFYKLAQQNDGENTSGSFFNSPSAKSLQGHSSNQSNFNHHNNNSDDNAGIIDLYSYTNRPDSSMTTFSDAPIGFSASTMSLAHLPSAATNDKVEVSGDMDEGTKTINDYVIVAPIGSGSQGVVELGVTLAGEPRAIKALKRSALMKQNEAAIRREVAIMKKLRHDNVIRLFEVIDDPSANMIYLVMKYCSNGPLVQIRPDFTCDSIPLPVAKSLLRQLLSGLHYLHLRRIVHRDIKPDNILLDHANVPCFVDFGVSGTVHKKSRTTTNTQGAAEGTPAFWAPELFQRKRDEQKRMSGTPGKDGVPLFPAPPIDLMAADVYALGATFFAAVTGHTPFTCENAEKLEEAVINEPLRLPNHLPASWKDLFMKMMDKDPQRRAKIPTLKLHAVFTDDGQDPGSPVDDLKVSDRDMNGAVTKLKGKSGYDENNNNNTTTNKNHEDGFGISGSTSQRDAFGDDDDAAAVDSDGNFVASTPRGQNNGSSSRALFHRRVAGGGAVGGGKRVAAQSFSHHHHHGGTSDDHSHHVKASSGNNNTKRGASHSPAGGGGAMHQNYSATHSNAFNHHHNNNDDNNTLLPRSYSTARMPLKNVVRASGGNNSNDYQSPLNGANTGRLGSSNGAPTKLPPLRRPSSSGK